MDFPIAQLVGRANYASWRVEMKVALISKGLWRVTLLKEQSTKPHSPELGPPPPALGPNPSHDEKTANMKAQAKYDDEKKAHAKALVKFKDDLDAWNDSRRRAFAFIVFHVTPAARVFIPNLNDPEPNKPTDDPNLDPHLAWEELRRQFESGGFSHKMELYVKLHSLKLADVASVDEYIETLKRLQQELANAGGEIASWKMAALLLNGLGPQYDTFTMLVVANADKGDPNFNDLARQLRNEESRRLKYEKGKSLDLDDPES